MTTVDSHIAMPAPASVMRRQPLWRRMTANRLSVFGAAILAIMVVVAVFAPLIARIDPTYQDYSAIQQAPNTAHLFGTDGLGRDVFSRIVYGARVSLSVGVFTQLIALAAGIPVGAIAGFMGGRVDNVLMRLVDMLYGFPDLLVIILLRAAFGGGLFMIFLAIGLVSWGNIARLIRGQVLSLKEREFVLAARSLGATSPFIIRRHLIPNSLGPIIVAVTFAIPRAIFVEAALSYIGLGVRPPTPTWGAMIRDGYDLIYSAPHAVVFPAAAVAITMLVFTFVGDGLRDAIDPHGDPSARGPAA